MIRTTRRTALLGDLIAAVFEEAEEHSDDQRVVSRLATRTVMRMLKRAARLGWHFEGGTPWTT